LLALFIVVFIGFLTVAISFFDEAAEFDLRQLSPVYVSGVLLGLCMTAGFVRAMTRNRVVQGAIIVLCIAFVEPYAVRAAQFVAHVHRDGLGYASRDWRQSQLVQLVSALPIGMHIYSNGPAAIFMLTGRPVDKIPTKFSPKYSAEMAVLRREIETQNAVLVYFDTITWRRGSLSEAELKAVLPLRLIGSALDGSIYGLER
jgi:hypothetical protein